MRSLINIIAIFIILIIMPAITNAQVEADYSVKINDEGAFLFYGTSYSINMPNNNCIEFIEDTKIIKGEKYILIRLRDEMINDRGVVIFDKKGNQINYDIVQEQRKLHYKSYECCVYVEELNGKLYFYDIIDLDGEDYDCSMDSQTDASDYTIPRYYIFDAKTNSVETIILKNKCTDLIKDGKLICE